MIDSREKGARAELAVRDILRKYSGGGFERVPLSGGLDAKHLMKGDIYIPGERNVFCIEVKHYKESMLTSAILTSKKPLIEEFWEQTIREANQVLQKPLLIFKFDRSKWFVGFEDLPSTDEYRRLDINLHGYVFHVTTLDEWLKYEKPVFSKGVV